MTCVVDMMELLSNLLQLLTACLVLFSGIVVGLDRHRVIFDNGLICKQISFRILPSNHTNFSVITTSPFSIRPGSGSKQTMIMTICSDMTVLSPIILVLYFLILSIDEWNFRFWSTGCLGSVKNIDIFFALIKVLK